MGSEASAVEREFSMRLESRGDTAVAILEGEFDLSSEEKFKRILGGFERDGLRALVFDLRKLSFIDSSGLRMLLQVWERSKQEEFEFSLVPGADQVREVLEITGVTRYVKVVDDVGPANGPPA